MVGHYNCCVSGCSNTYSNTKDVQFYRFPARSSQAERKQNWIRFVRRRRINVDGTQWVPTQNSRICSVHFVGNQKSELPDHPSFNPTILLLADRPKQQKLKRFERIFRRTVIAEKPRNSPEVTNQLIIEPEPMEEIEIEITKSTQSTQTHCFEYQKYGPLSRWELSIGHQSDNHSEISTQVSHDPYRPVADKVDRSTGPDPGFPVFLGYDSLTPTRLYQLTLTSNETFRKLLNLMDNYSRHSLNRQNCLLLFLIKLKSAMPFSVLGSFFDKDRTTVQRIFNSVLNHLVQRTKDQSSWYPANTTTEQLIFPVPQIVDKKIEFVTQPKSQPQQQQRPISLELLIYKIRLFDIVKCPLTTELVDLAEDIVHICCLIVYLQTIPSISIESSTTDSTGTVKQSQPQPSCSNIGTSFGSIMIRQSINHY